jgi:hypothetical protein
MKDYTELSMNACKHAADFADTYERRSNDISTLALCRIAIMLATAIVEAILSVAQAISRNGRE